MAFWPLRSGGGNPPLLPDRRDRRWFKHHTMADGCALYTSRAGAMCPVALTIVTARGELPPRLFGYILGLTRGREDVIVQTHFGGERMHIPVKYVSKIEPSTAKKEKPPAPVEPTRPPLVRPPEPPPWDPREHGKPRNEADAWVPKHPVDYGVAWDNMDLESRGNLLRSIQPDMWSKMTLEEQWHWLYGPRIGIESPCDRSLSPTWEEWKRDWKQVYQVPVETSYGARRPPAYQEYRSPWAE